MARDIEPIRCTLARTIGAINVVADVTLDRVTDNFVVTFMDGKTKLIDFMTARDLHDLVEDVRMQLR